MPDSSSSATLLFVDDEPNILLSLKRLFRAQNHRILMAGGGSEALAVLERESVDLVISDMRMPEMDGARFLEQVRARWPQIVRILLTGHSDMSATIDAINRGEIYRYVTKPWNDDDLLLTVRDALERKRLEAENTRLDALTRRQNEELKELNASLEQKVAERTDQLRRALLSLEQSHKTLKKEFLSSLMVFSGLLELRGRHLGDWLTGHGRRVANAARKVAQHMGLDDAAVQDVMFAGLLHDIGKIALPDSMLDQPFVTLSPEARAEVQKHPLIGENVLMAVAELKGATPIIRHHHELLDGSGYPDGLSGSAIPLGARILAVVNDYDALQLGILMPRAMSADEALAYLQDNRGNRYDAQVVDAFVAAGLPEPVPGAPHREQTDLPVAAVDAIVLRPAQLQSGMVLAGDLTHRDGYLLLASGHVLDSHLIERLALLEEYDRHPLPVLVHDDTLQEGSAAVG